MTDIQIRELRKRLLNWHYQKARTANIVDLLSSDYQRFRRRVANRIGDSKIDFREAIKNANQDELCQLEQTRDELRLKI